MSHSPDPAWLDRLFSQPLVVAVVGASTDPAKPAHTIPAYLQEQGFDIIPVNPRGGRILDVDAVASLADIDRHVDVVDVFRPSDETPEIARQAAGIGADVLWLQLGIESGEAAAIAHEAGMTVVMDTCLGATHRRWARSQDDG